MNGTAVSLFRDAVRRHGGRVVFRALAAGGAAQDATFTWREWGEAADQAAAALIDAGCARREVAAVLAGNTPIWPIADLGILAAGMVSAGVYPTSAPQQIRQVLDDCSASVVFVDSRERLDRLRAVAADLPHLRWIVVGDGLATSAEDGIAGAVGGANLVSWREWLRRGALARLREAVATELEARGRALRPEDTAILIYTSGSTGEPKGALIPHRYLLASAASIRDALGLCESDTTLSFLPYCHAGERVFGLYTRILCGMEAGLVADHTRLWDAARAFAPTVFGGLPRFYEKVYETLQTERHAAVGDERDRWERVLEQGRLLSRLRRAGAEIAIDHEARWRADAGPLLERVRLSFGGRMRLATSGGATLPTEVAEFLDALGVTVLGAYGLTEHLCVAFNRADRYVFDGVGPPMPGTTLRIADDGEILVRRCALTFAGYLGRSRESVEAFTADGEWLLTGDLGAVDAAGFLHVSGRKKELIALSTGKKVAPLAIEAKLQEDPWISQAMLYGEGRKFISALLCLRRPVVEAWARKQAGDAHADYGALVKLPAVRARVQQAVDRVNAGLSRTEQVRRLVILDRDFSVEADELTPTLKLRRGVIAARYQEQLDALYNGAP